MEKSEISHIQFDGTKQNSTKVNLNLNYEVIEEVKTYKYLKHLKDNRSSLDKTIGNRRNSAKAVINEIQFLVKQIPFKEKALELSI